MAGVRPATDPSRFLCVQLEVGCCHRKFFDPVITAECFLDTDELMAAIEEINSFMTQALPPWKVDLPHIGVMTGFIQTMGFYACVLLKQDVVGAVLLHLSLLIGVVSMLGLLRLHCDLVRAVEALKAKLSDMTARQSIQGVDFSLHESTALDILLINLDHRDGARGGFKVNLRTLSPHVLVIQAIGADGQLAIPSA